MTKNAKENLHIAGFILLFVAIVASIVTYALSPKFKAGDCFQYKYAESWEKSNYIYKVLTVGKKHYLSTFTLPGHSFNSNPEEASLTDEDRIDFIDEGYQKVKCP